MPACLCLSNIPSLRHDSPYSLAKNKEEEGKGLNKGKNCVHSHVTTSPHLQLLFFYEKEKKDVKKALYGEERRRGRRWATCGMRICASRMRKEAASSLLLSMYGTFEHGRKEEEAGSHVI